MDHISNDEIKVLGIDLAGSEKRRTGWCLMNLKLEVFHGIVFSDNEIIIAFFSGIEIIYQLEGIKRVA